MKYRAGSLVPALLYAGALLPSVGAVDPLVDLGYTKLQGVAEQIGVTQWLGVRFAAPPLGQLRFAAPVDPQPTTDVVDATKFQPICLSRQPSDFTNKPNKRFTVAEDCLFLNIFAPSNATRDAKVPVMYFIQGGGFQSNSNANFNASDLAKFGGIVVVQVNYRVGPFGFLQSREVQSGGSLNVGLKDQIQGLKWLQAHIATFGGDPNRIVAAGDSAGATSIALLLAAFAEKDPGYIKGAILESPSVATIRTLEQGQEQYNCLLNATRCTGAPDTLACLRAVNATALQTEQCQFNPGLDNDLIKNSMLSNFDNGRYLKIPVIAGTCTDEGTKNVPQNTNTTAQALKFVNDQAFDVLTNNSLGMVNQVYISPAQPVFPNSGAKWRQLANAHGDFRAHCITARLQNALARDGVKTYNYRYAVLDPEQETLGFGAYHTVELNGVFGPNNTDGAPPKSYFTSNAAIVPITMAYWTSFVKTLSPNEQKIPGTPDWLPWTGPDDRSRLRFQTNNTLMEKMNETQKANCEMFDPMLPAIEEPQVVRFVQLNKPGVATNTSWAVIPGNTLRIYKKETSIIL
ncbi:carboxylesterase [Thozetella sp. PMI_491]|nr:carboxylesterase [Thozetella sp. PMI_491]